MLLCFALCSGTAALAQDAKKNLTKAADGLDQYPDKFEIDPFGGVSTYGQVNRGLNTKMATGGLGGVRLAYNPYAHFGLELWMDYVVANEVFGNSNGAIPAGISGSPGPVAPYSFGNRNWVFGFDPVFNLTPRGSRVQPYVTAGVNGIQFTPTSTAINLANQPTNILLYHAQSLNDNLQVGFNFGGGVKWHFTDHWGARFDVRGLVNRNPTFGLPNAFNGGGVFIPSKDRQTGLQATLGLVYFGGTNKCPDMPAAPPPPAPLPAVSISGGDGSSGAGSTGFCPGKPVTLHANMAAPADRKLAYSWTVNGQTQSSTTPDLTFTPGAGASNVQVTVTDTTPPPPPMEKPKKFPARCWVQPPAPAPVAPVSGTTTVTVSDAGPSISSVTASPSELSFNGTGPRTANLAGITQASPCGGNLTCKWTVSEGSVTNDTSPNAQFDATSITFEPSAQAQSKTVTATLTCTDESGKTTSKSTTMTVTYTPQWVRLDDVIYAKNNTRVNNCGKRLLIDDAASRMANGDYDIILVGHRDTDESEKVMGKGKKAMAGPGLDEQRLLNAAAILSGGTGTCGKVDPSRIKMDVVGTDQTSEARPGQCGTSNTQERKGSETSEADKNRRVEVYLVPHSSTVQPPAVKNVRPIPETAVKSLSCPH